MMSKSNEILSPSPNVRKGCIDTSVLADRITSNLSIRDARKHCQNRLKEFERRETKTDVCNEESENLLHLPPGSRDSIELLKELDQTDIYELYEYLLRHPSPLEHVTTIDLSPVKKEGVKKPYPKDSAST